MRHGPTVSEATGPGRHRGRTRAAMKIAAGVGSFDQPDNRLTSNPDGFSPPCPSCCFIFLGGDRLNVILPLSSNYAVKGIFIKNKNASFRWTLRISTSMRHRLKSLSSCRRASAGVGGHDGVLGDEPSPALFHQDDFP